jgi:formylglycine-generating enzyme required for sulfatase activity
MKQTQLSAVLGVLIVGLAARGAHAGWPGDPAKCKPDAVKAGSVCMDKYEASVWQVPNPTTTNKGLVKKIQSGTATLANLTAGGATQISPATSCSPAFPGTFPANGQWTEPLYAVSIPGVHPTACVTWFQAQQACANSRKRLPSNGEWQGAASGTPEGAAGDDGTTQCNTSTAGDAVDTGSRSACVSNYGAFDMVGNVYEWVADWVPRSTACGSWSGSSDSQCLAGAATSGEPGALFRGGGFLSGP